MRRYLWPLGIAAVLVIIAGVSYAVYFAGRANPQHTPPGRATACGTAVPATGLRTFHIVPDQTTASYKVHENLVLRNLPNNDAVGKTHAVQGGFHIRTSASPLVADMNITVDLRTLQTDEPQRDHYVRQNYLESDTYPTAAFASTCAQGLPANYADGQPVTFQMIGNLTIHGKTNKETFNVQGKVVGNMVTGTATSTVFMTDFGIQPPNLSDIAIAENKVLITITFTAKEG